KGEEEGGTEVGQLDQAGLERTHLEDVFETGHHWRGEVGRDPPSREAADEDHEEQTHLGINKALFHRHRALGVVVRDCLRHGGHVPSRTSVIDLRWSASGYVPCSSRRWSSPGPRAARRPRLVSAGWHPAGNM